MPWAIASAVCVGSLLGIPVFPHGGAAPAPSFGASTASSLRSPGSTPTYVTNISINSSNDPSFGTGPIVYDPNNGGIYVAANGTSGPGPVGGGISHLSTLSYTVLDNIGLNYTATMMAFDPADNFLVTSWYTLCANSTLAGCISDPYGILYYSNITVVSTLHDRTVGSVPVAAPYGAVYDAANGNLYTSNLITTNVSVLNGSRLASNPPTLGTFAAPGGTGVSCYDSANGDVYVTGFNNMGTYGSGAGVYVYGPRGSGGYGLIAGITSITQRPRGCAYDPANGLLYVGEYGYGQVGVYNVSSNATSPPLVTQISLASGASDPWGITYGGGDLFVTYTPGTTPSGGFHYVTIINGASNTIVGELGPGALAPGYAAYDPATSTLWVSGLERSAVTVFALGAPVYLNTISFDASGLPSGTTWGVNLTGVSPGLATTPGPVTFLVANGSYAYALDRVAGFSPASYRGVVDVDGSGAVVQISFHVTTYLLQFVESGLAPGIRWTVSVTGEGSNTTPAPGTNELYLPNGSYPYSVVPVAGYVLRAGSVVNVTGASLTVPATFLPAISLTFVESGLPAATSWGVAINGTNPLSTPAPTSIVVYLLPATYHYTIAAVAGYTVAAGDWSGSVDLSGPARTVPVTWAPVNYTASFFETGLPAGTVWSVELGGSNLTARAPSPNVVDLQNGSYGYTVNGVPGYTTPVWSGTLVVDGIAPSLGIAFSPVNYTVTFRSSGLPSGTSWGVTLAGATEHSTGDSLSFEEGNGSYLWSATSVPLYAAEPAAGTLGVAGENESVSLTFTRLYPLSFTESGLPAGTEWSVALDGGTYRSDSATIAFSLNASGRFSYQYGVVPGYTLSSFGSSVTVSSTTPAIHVSFTTGEEVVFDPGGELPLSAPGPAGNWSLAVNAGTFSSEPGAPIDLWLASGAFTISLTAPAGYTAIAPSGTILVGGLAEQIGVPVTPDSEAYTLTLEELGLPAGLGWNATVSQLTISSTGPTLAMVLGNGTYASVIGPPPGYVAHPSTASATVDGAPAFVRITFAVPSSVSAASSTSWILWAGGLGGAVAIAAAALLVYRRGGRRRPATVAPPAERAERRAPADSDGEEDLSSMDE